MSLIAMAFLWTGSQIPLYLFGAYTNTHSPRCHDKPTNPFLHAGGIPPYIYRDIGGADRWIWFVLANLLSLAAICPFVGALSDLLGRRYVAISGAAFLVLGNIISSTAHTMNIFIGKAVPSIRFSFCTPN